MYTIKRCWGAFRASSADWKRKLKTAGIARIAVVISVVTVLLLVPTWVEHFVTVVFGPAAGALIDVDRVTSITQCVGNLAIVVAILMLVAFSCAALQAWTGWGLILSAGLTFTGLLWRDLKRILAESMRMLLPRPFQEDYLVFVDANFEFLSITVSGLMLSITAYGGYVTFRAMKIRLAEGEAALQNSRFGEWLRRDSVNIVREVQDLIAKRSPLFSGKVDNPKTPSKMHTQKAKQKPQQKKSARKARRSSQRYNRRAK